MKTVLTLAILFCALMALAPPDASALTMGNAGLDDCGVFSGVIRHTGCEDMGAGSVGQSWRQRMNIDELAEKVAFIKRSFASPLQFFKPSPEID